VPYVQGKHLRSSADESVIETDFHVDHTEVDALVVQIPAWRNLMWGMSTLRSLSRLNSTAVYPE
jgi:hypothetical protein